MTNTDAEAKRDFVRKSFSEAAATYDVSPYFELPGRRIVELAGVKQGDRVLDVATGRGAVLWPALEAVGPTGHIDAIDLAPPMIERTLADVNARGVSNVTLQLMDAEHLDFPDDTFDVVLCGFVLWFIPNLDLALSELLRVLKPGGTLAATTWAAARGMVVDLQNLMRKYGAGGDGLGSHNLGTIEMLTGALTQAGFTDARGLNEDSTYTFGSVEEWWTRAGARPQLVHTLTPEQLANLRAEAIDLARNHLQDGKLTSPRMVTYGSAKKPG